MQNECHRKAHLIVGCLPTCCRDHTLHAKELISLLKYKLSLFVLNGFFLVLVGLALEVFGVVLGLFSFLFGWLGFFVMRVY